MSKHQYNNLPRYRELSYGETEGPCYLLDDKQNKIRDYESSAFGNDCLGIVEVSKSTQ